MSAEHTKLETRFDTGLKSLETRFDTGLKTLLEGYRPRFVRKYNSKDSA